MLFMFDLIVGTKMDLKHYKKMNENRCGKCKNRTAADGPHDKREMPACAFRLVNTEVKPTSAFSKR